MSKWFNDWCRLTNLERETIKDRLRPLCGDSYWWEIYISITLKHKLTRSEINDIIDRFNSSRDQPGIQKLIDKLERLHSQS